MFNELLSELTPGEEHPEDRRLLHDVSGTCREMQVLLFTKYHDVNVIHINNQVGGIIALIHDSIAFTCAMLKDNGGKD